MGQRIRDEIIFAGSGLDTDSDIHFLRKGDTDVRWNLIPSGDGENHVLTVVNGNYEVTHSFDLTMFTNPVVVGSCYSASDNMHYYFLCDKDGIQGILRYNVDGDRIERVLMPYDQGEYLENHVWNNLGFSVTSIIYDAFVLDDFLFWNPRTSSPRMLNIKWAMNLMLALDNDGKTEYDAGELYYYKGKVYEVLADGTTASDLNDEIEKVVTPDVEIPVLVSASVEQANPDEIVLVFSTALNEGSSPLTTDFSVWGKTVTSVVVQGYNVTLTLDAEYDYGDYVYVSYTKPATDRLLGVGGGEVASFTNYAVTNNILPIPYPESASVEKGAEDKVVVLFNLALDESYVPNTFAFSLAGKTITDVDVSGSTVTLTVSVAYVYTDVITLDYTGSLPYLQSTGGVYVEDFSSLSVTNNISSPFSLSLANTLLSPFHEATTYSFNVENEGGETFLNDFRVNFRCYIGVDGVEYTNNWAFSDSYVQIVGGATELVVTTFVTQLASNVDFDRQYEIYVYYDNGVNDWVQLGTKIWNEGVT